LTVHEHLTPLHARHNRGQPRERREVIVGVLERVNRPMEGEVIV
jgi:hypothetical protein